MAEGKILEGYIIIARKLISNELIHARAETFKCAVMEIANANWEPKNWWDGEKSIPIDRGQFVTSVRHFAEDCCLSIQNIRTSWKELERLRFSTHKPTQRYTVVTIRNYKYFQDKSNYGVTQPLTHDQHTPNTPLTTTKELKALKNGNKEPLLSKQKRFDLKAPIEYLNQKTNHKYRPETYSDMVRARYNEGRTLEDFKLIVDKKCEDWFTDEKMVKYLRPETLFTKKHFDSYLNEPACKPKTELDQWRARGDQR